MRVCVKETNKRVHQSKSKARTEFSLTFFIKVELQLMYYVEMFLPFTHCWKDLPKENKKYLAFQQQYDKTSDSSHQHLQRYHQ